MNTIELLRDLSRFVCTKNKGHWGVFACDQLPKEKITRPCLIICNTAPQSHPGIHWTAFYFGPRGKTAEFFDSFGRPPTLKKQFLRFIKNNSTSYIYNDKKIQGSYSTTCGNFSICYLYYRCLNRSMKTFLIEFDTKKPELNDKKIMKMYAKLSATLNNKMRKNVNQSGGKYSVITCNQTCAPLRRKK